MFIAHIVRSYFRFALGGALFLIASLALTCAWDYDTLSSESKKLPTLLDGLVGRIRVNPPEYYQRRIELATDLIKREPGNLEAYDNLAMAHDFLGDAKSAYAVLETKRLAMVENGVKSSGDPMHDPWYRYHANLGTVYAHDWARNKAEGTAKLDRAIAELSKALKINPKAHFGREIVQIEVLHLLKSKQEPNAAGGFKDQHVAWQNFVKLHGPEKVSEAVIAIMAFGSGPDNADLISVLAHCIDMRDGIVGTIAKLRFDELVEKDSAQAKTFDVHFYSPYNEQHVKSQFSELRFDAMAYQEHRKSYILEQLRLGRHPDTHADFWDGYKEPPRMELKEPLNLNRYMQRNFMVQVLIVIGAAALLLAVGLTIRNALRRGNEVAS